MDRRFQFLIGRLVTHHIGDAIQEALTFQFLIGRLVTRGICPVELIPARFQFLIGRLVTNNSARFTEKNFFVSIPHR